LLASLATKTVVVVASTFSILNQYEDEVDERRQEHREDGEREQALEEEDDGLLVARNKHPE